MQVRQTYNSTLRSIWENQNPINVLLVAKHSPTAPTSHNTREFILVLNHTDVKYVNESLLNYHIYNNTSEHILVTNLTNAEYQVITIALILNIINDLFLLINATDSLYKSTAIIIPLRINSTKSIVERSSCWSSGWKWRYCYFSCLHWYQTWWPVTSAWYLVSIPCLPVIQMLLYHFKPIEVLSTDKNYCYCLLLQCNEN